VAQLIPSGVKESVRLRTEYVLAFEGTGKFEINVPKQIQRVKIVTAEVFGKANYLDKVRFIDRNGMEFLVLPLAMILSIGYVPIHQFRPEYTRPHYYGSCIAPEGVTIRGWGKVTTVQKLPSTNGNGVEGDKK